MKRGVGTQQVRWRAAPLPWLAEDRPETKPGQKLLEPSLRPRRVGPFDLPWRASVSDERHDVLRIGADLRGLSR